MQAVSKNIGADNLKTLEISGTEGYSAAVGAPYSADQDWPRGELVNYSKEIDFDAHFSREQLPGPRGPIRLSEAHKAFPNADSRVRLRTQRRYRLGGAGGGAGPYDRQGYMDGIPVAQMWQLR